MDGHRPELRKSWPERLRVLLASAWHTDFSKRPTAAEIVSVLEDIKADLSEREQRRPFTTAPSFGNTSRARSNSRTQRAVSAPGSICHARGPSVHNGGGGGGGGNAPPGASPVRKRISLPLIPPPAAEKRSWYFAAKKTTARRTSGNSRASKEESKAKETLPLPPTRSFPSTTAIANTAEDDEGTGVAADSCPRPHSDLTNLPRHRRHHEEGTSQREIIAEALAREAEVAQQEASAKHELTMRAVRHLGRTAGEPGRFTDRERRSAERQEHGVDLARLRVAAGGEGGKGEEKARGGGAGSRSAGQDDTVDVTADLSQAATEEVPARLHRDSSVETAAEELPASLFSHSISQETAENVPASARRHHSNSQRGEEITAHVRGYNSLQETAGEEAPRVNRHNSLEATAGEVSARVSHHTDVESTAAGVAGRLSRGSSLSKLWPSKSHWSNNPEDSSSSHWAWRTSRNGSAGLFSATKILPRDEHVRDDTGPDERPAAMSAGAPAGRPFTPFAPTVRHVCICVRACVCVLCGAADLRELYVGT